MYSREHVATVSSWLLVLALVACTQVSAQDTVGTTTSSLTSTPLKTMTEQLAGVVPTVSMGSSAPLSASSTAQSTKTMDTSSLMTSDTQSTEFGTATSETVAVSPTTATNGGLSTPAVSSDEPTPVPTSTVLVDPMSSMETSSTVLITMRQPMTVDASLMAPSTAVENIPESSSSSPGIATDSSMEPSRTVPDTMATLVLSSSPSRDNASPEPVPDSSSEGGLDITWIAAIAAGGAAIVVLGVLILLVLLLIVLRRRKRRRGSRGKPKKARKVVGDKRSESFVLHKMNRLAFTDTNSRV